MPFLDWRQPEKRALGNNSVVGLLADMTKEERSDFLYTLSDEEALQAMYDWDLWARPNQLAPENCECHQGNWRTWLILAGRGFGKTRCGAEWIRQRQESGKYGRFALIGRSTADVRDTMVLGESGIINISPPWNRPTYQVSKRRVEWPNGAYGIMFSAEEPDQLRGPQHDSAWLDELAAWKYPDAFDQLQFGLRLGMDPRSVVTTTPRPTKLMRELVKSPYVHTTAGSTYENLTNLAQAFADQIIKKYEGTRLGKQELRGLLLDDIEGALWNVSMFDDRRRQENYKRIVVAIDPSTEEEGRGAEAGIIVAGIQTGLDGRDVGYVLEDATVRDSPLGWAKAAVSAYKRHHADRIIAEKNNGGAMVEAVIRSVDPNIAYKAVTAARGKLPRAEPVVALYQQNRVFHTTEFPELEEQLTTWTPNDNESPDRLDALVWAMTELLLPEEAEASKIISFGSARGGWLRAV